MKKKQKRSASTKKAITRIKAAAERRRPCQTASLPRVELRRLADLRPHSLASLIFGKMPPRMLDYLAKDLPEYVTQDPDSYDPEQTEIEILADGRIIHGFVFAEVHAANGDEEAAVLVRRDLEELGQDAIAARIMEKPPYSPEHSPIEKFRCDLVRHGHLDELKRLKNGELLDCSTVETIAESIGVHPAVVSIMFRAHCAPTELIEYVERDLLSPQIVCELIKDEDAPLAEALGILDYEEDQAFAIHRSSNRDELDGRVEALLAYHRGEAADFCREELRNLLSNIQYQLELLEDGWPLDEVDIENVIPYLQLLSKSSDCAFRMAVQSKIIDFHHAA